MHISAELRLIATRKSPKSIAQVLVALQLLGEECKGKEASSQQV